MGKHRMENCSKGEKPLMNSNNISNHPHIFLAAKKHTHSTLYLNANKKQKILCSIIFT
jgi:hypothetical protein